MPATFLQTSISPKHLGALKKIAPELKKKHRKKIWAIAKMCHFAVQNHISLTPAARRKLLKRSLNSLEKVKKNLEELEIESPAHLKHIDLSLKQLGYGSESSPISYALLDGLAESIRLQMADEPELSKSGRKASSTHIFLISQLAQYFIQRLNEKPYKVYKSRHSVFYKLVIYLAEHALERPIADPVNQISRVIDEIKGVTIDKK